jgi:hypothetical protein
MRIVVTEGVGALERPLYTCLLAAGHDVRVLGDSPGELPVGVRPIDGVAGAGVLVHRLPGLDAALDALDQHIPVVLVATEPADAVEDALGGRTGWTLQVTTTLHPDLDARLRSWQRGPLVEVPTGVLVQPVDAGEVAARLILLVRAGPAGRVPDYGGPAARPLDDLARAWADARIDGGGRVVPVKGTAPWAFPTARRAVGRVGWEEYLSDPGQEPCCADALRDLAAGPPVGGGGLVVAGPAPRLQHPGPVEAGSGEPRHRPQPLVAGERGGEVAFGLLPLAEDGGQHPE